MNGDQTMTGRGAWQRFAATALGVLAGGVAAAGTLAVAVAGFTLSYDAIRAVGIAAGIRRDWAWLLPVSPDGAMAVATVAAVVMRRMGRSTVYPWAVVLAGAAISIACNATHARMRDHIALDDRTAMAVSAIPAVMLALSVHLLVVLVDAAATVMRGAQAPVKATATPTDQVGDQTDQTADHTPTMVASGRTLVEAPDPMPADPFVNDMPTDPWVYSTPWANADQTSDQTPDLRDQTPDQTDQTSDQNDQDEIRPRPDADLVDQFGGHLRALAAVGKLNRYQVEKITGANKNQALRLLDQITAEGDQTTDQTDLVATTTTGGTK